MEIFIVQFREKTSQLGSTFLKEYYMDNVSPRVLRVSRLKMMTENIEWALFIAFKREGFKRNINEVTHVSRVEFK